MGTEKWDLVQIADGIYCDESNDEILQDSERNMVQVFL